MQILLQHDARRAERTGCGGEKNASARKQSNGAQNAYHCRTPQARGANGEAGAGRKKADAPARNAKARLLLLVPVTGLEPVRV